MIKINRAKVFKTGNSHVVVIPSAYIKNGLIDPEKYYEIELKVIDTNEKD